MSFRNFIDYNTTKQERIKNKIRYQKEERKQEVQKPNVSKNKERETMDENINYLDKASELKETLKEKIDAVFYRFGTTGLEKLDESIINTVLELKGEKPVRKRRASKPRVTESKKVTSTPKKNNNAKKNDFKSLMQSMNTPEITSESMSILENLEDKYDENVPDRYLNIKNVNDVNTQIGVEQVSKPKQSSNNSVYDMMNDTSLFEEFSDKDILNSANGVHEYDQNSPEYLAMISEGLDEDIKNEVLNVPIQDDVQDSVKQINEGSEKKGGINSSPKTSKPKIKVSGQNVSSKTKKSKRNS